MANFMTRARAVDLLGKQQIRDEVTAISELLRNAYDADASEGLIDVDTLQGRILVWDDGDGMSESEVQENWLTLGTYSKVDSKKTRKDRIKIGEKGIGRLAISLLGDQLLLISKKKGGNVWTALYLHWELFRNEKIFLETVKIPLKSFNSFGNLLHFLKSEFDCFKNELLSNLDNTDIWNDSISNKIKQDIAEFAISDDAINKLRINDKRGCGTLFYISSLANTWDWSIYKSNVKEESLKRRVQRLKDVVFSFKNIIDSFDNEESSNGESLNKDSKDFIPKIHIDGLKLENETWFNPEEMKLYDYALKGEISSGDFSGEVIIRYLDKVESTKVNNIPLTRGMYINSIDDCGPIRIKWFFLEGTEKLSSLNKDQFRLMMDKLERMGGIFVIRDGLRILPYGEPGNDFLNIEERRSKGAGYYLFSHRRMYGFMEISKKNNPGLIDKSSREGFIENKEFNFFRTVAENLLIWWATDFLESQKDSGKRAIRNNRLREEYEKKQKEYEKKKQEEKHERDYFTQLDTYLQQFAERLNIKYNNIKMEIDNEILKLDNRSYDHIKSRIDIHEITFNIQERVYSIIERLNDCKINLSLRYSHELYILEEIEKCNIEIENKRNSLREYANESIEIVKARIGKKLDAFLKNQELYDSLSNKLVSMMNWIDKFCVDDASGIEYESIRTIQSELSSINQKILFVANNQIAEKKKPFLLQVESLKSKHREIRALFERLQSLEFYTDPEKLKSDIELAVNEFENIMNKAQQLRIELLDDEENSSRIKSITQFIRNLNSKISTSRYIDWDDEYIGMMKKEVNMYRDLSSVGLAAELTSHEFNGLYHTIRDNINTLYQALSETKVLPYLDRTRTAFASLERLHQRMSPLYRQARYRQKEIKVHEIINNILEYFGSDIERYQVKIVNDVPTDVTIKEVEAVLFTPLINLLSNAIYWIMDRPIREIHFYISPDWRYLYVHDTGLGIIERDREKIFEPFYSKKIGGRGLGLYLSRDILESKGHQLYCVAAGEELRPIVGACFCICFNKDSVVGGNEK